eukprot:g4847.t1
MEILDCDPDRPRFHVMPVKGWMNDPNGPIYYRGKYHLFYQHVRDRVEWDWGLVWGHAVSEDLVFWDHLPVAIEPTPNGFDSDGCFSGCCVLDANGVPTLLYTGVKLRSNFDQKHPLPSNEYDLQLPFIETQLAARADPNDNYLKRFTKQEEPIVALPPPSMNLTGWRDPFVVKGLHNGEHLMLVGSGIKGKGGSVLKYKSSDILSGWKFAGHLCTGDADTGAVWECPILVKLKLHQDSIHTPSQDLETQFDALHLDTNDQYLFCVSPDAPTNPVLYWLGSFNQEELVFERDQNSTPFRLDLGDILYAPNLTESPYGDTLLWGWLQEKRQVGSYDYSGCLSVPRKLTIKNGKLHQSPVDEIAKLRLGDEWKVEGIEIFPEEPIAVEELQGQSLDFEIELERGTSEAAGLLIRSWRVGGEGTAAIVFDWERSCLDVVFEALDPETMEFYLDSEDSHRIGGPVEWNSKEPLKLRILLDHSCLEVFTGSGEVLSTRVYRGAPDFDGDSGVDFVSFGGVAELVSASVYEMKSIWRKDESMSIINNEQKKTGQSLPPTAAELELHPTSSPIMISPSNNSTVE